MDEQKGGITYSWLTGVLIVVLGALVSMLVTYQAGVNTTQGNAISSLNTESLKQTALMVVIAEKDGISPYEVNQLLGIPQQISSNQ